MCDGMMGRDDPHSFPAPCLQQPAPMGPSCLSREQGSLAQDKFVCPVLSQSDHTLEDPFSELLVGPVLGDPLEAMQQID